MTSRQSSESDQSKNNSESKQAANCPSRRPPPAQALQTARFFKFAETIRELTAGNTQRDSP